VALLCYDHFGSILEERLMARGDHIRTRRRGYWHHGIDCGDGTVIHYTGTPFRLREAVVERCSLEDFHRGRRLEVLLHDSMLDASLIIERAESCLGERSYHLLRRNCEHFACWCATGREESTQVTRAARAFVTGSVVVAVGVAATAAYIAKKAAESSEASEA
jgi:hypothetical protein